MAFTALPALQGAVDVMTAMIKDASHRSKQGGKQGMYKLPVLNLDQPDLFPCQNVLSEVMHRLTAQDLLKKTTDWRSQELDTPMLFTSIWPLAAYYTDSMLLQGFI